MNDNMINLDNIYVHGRYYLCDQLQIFNTASGIEFNANLSFFSIKMKAVAKQKNQAWMKVIIDNDYDNQVDIKIDTNEKEYVIFSHKENKIHNIKVLKASEAIESFVEISDISVKGEFLDKPKYDKTFLVIGDSTVSAFGNLGRVGEEKTLFDTDGLKGYCYLTSIYFNASMNSLNGSGWGLVFSPWTTPKRRPLLSLFSKVAPLSDLEFDIKNINPSLVIISLGVNDYFYINIGEERKTKEELIDEFKNGYHTLLELIKTNYGSIPVVMVYGVMKETLNYPLMHNIYLDNKDKFNLYEALLEGDGLGITLHPSQASHKEMSIKLIEKLKVILNE